MLPRATREREPGAGRFRLAPAARAR